ncbi:unnamed protein product [Prorocentrum cordatum]|uniref:WWE domain-containing protein n=1 Tax=Prorocentrum cordatum TaxID=2364126 RepID=A0ABN9VS82_9DINO|nr:unnamed protein product [Polarella glacialis]
MQDLRQDMREWLPRALSLDEETKSHTLRPGDVNDHGAPGRDVSPEEIKQLNRIQSYDLPDGNSAPNLRLREVTAAPEEAQDQIPSEVANRIEVTGTGTITSNIVAMDPPGSQEDDNLENRAVYWEWERSNDMGWKSYPAFQSEKIEKAWQSGVSRVRVRSGCDGRTPMEIFFVDMLQLDPESENLRRIRRVGKAPWYMTSRRFWRSVSHSWETGEPLWENLHQYRYRQSSLPTAEKMFQKPSSRSLGSSRTNSQPAVTSSPVQRRLRRLVTSSSCISFFNLSNLITLSWCVWFGIDVQRYPDGTSLYEKEALFTTIELCFNVFFLVELVIRVGACVSFLECFRDVWICIDALCVIGSLADVLILPIAATLKLHEVGNSQLVAFRSVRLFKLLRIARLSRASVDMDIFCKGIWSGLRESSVVWTILIFLVFTFSVMLTTFGSPEMRETRFSSLLSSMHILLHSGVMLDGVADVMDDLVRSRDAAGYIIFLVFVIVSQYIILNMLIGVLSSVAGDVRGEEKARASIAYLRHNLKNLLECYIHDDGMISRPEFRLIITNADVHRIMSQFGADLEHLASMEKSLFAKGDYIDFDTMFDTISHLNQGKISTVWDIFHAQDALQRKLDSIDMKLSAAGFHGVP